MSSRTEHATPDEIDPELVKLIKPRVRVGLVTSGAIVLFSIFLMVKLRHDLAYSCAGGTPRGIDLTSVRNIANDSFVSVRAAPDRSLVGLVARTDADYGHRVAPVQGSNHGLWIMIDGSPWTAARSYEEVYSGRLRPLSALPFADNLHRFVAQHGAGLRYITTDALRATLTVAPTPPQLSEPGGDRVDLSPTTVVEITRKTVDAARVAADRVSYRAPWQALRGDATGVTVPADANHGTVSIPWTEVDAVGIDAVRTIPDDARVLLTHERPDSYWYLRPVYALLAVFALLFTWAFVLRLRDA
jgi:hypothetical protein